jgi:carbamoylphosphate synthase large subunit
MSFGSRTVTDGPDRERRPAPTIGRLTVRPRAGVVGILVTRGAGFIGSNLVEAHLEAGHDVAVLDDLSSGRTTNVSPAARLYRVDVRTAEVESVIVRERPDVLNPTLPRSACRAR